MDWRGFDQPYAGHPHAPLLDLPVRRGDRHWLEPARAGKASARGAVVSGRGADATPLLGVRLPSALSAAQFAAQWGLRKLPYLADHKVQGAVVAPGAAYLETALAAAREVFGAGAHVLEDVTFSQPLFLSEGRSHAVELVLEAEASDRSAFQFYQAPAGDDPKAAWTLHASGRRPPRREGARAPRRGASRWPGSGRGVPRNSTGRPVTAR